MPAIRAAALGCLPENILLESGNQVNREDAENLSKYKQDNVVSLQSC
jgi:hypothetical protein